MEIPGLDYDHKGQRVSPEQRAFQADLAKYELRIERDASGRVKPLTKRQREAWMKHLMDSKRDLDPTDVVALPFVGLTHQILFDADVRFPG